MTFRFEQFVDGPSAQAAFAAEFPVRSPADAALQALVDMGAQCKTVGPGVVACRYVENDGALAGWCWHLALHAAADRNIRGIEVSLARLGI
jgi:hypothetical protein